MNESKMKLTESTEEYFRTFSLVLDLFSKLFLIEPNQEMLSTLNGSGLLNSFPLPSISEEESSTLLEIEKCINQKKSIELIKGDFLKLFIGLDNVFAPPYASVYLDKEKLLFDKSTLLARSYYTKHKIEVEEYNQIPDDHLGLLLQFISISCNRISDVIKNKNEQVFQIILKDLSFVLDKLVLSWIQLFKERIKTYSTTTYYLSIASLTENTLLLLQKLITNIQNTSE